MNNHTGGATYLIWRFINCKSPKQKLNTEISTEAEVFGISDYVPFNIYIYLFLESKAYPLKSNVVYQDNQSEICMEINGWYLCTGSYHHIHIRYFFVKDR